MRRRIAHLRVPAPGVTVPVFLFVAAFAACKAGTHDDAAAATSSSSGSGFSTGSHSTGTVSGTGGAGASCALYQHTEVHKPLNLYIMFDKSSSMAGTKWTAAQAGLSAFVQNPGMDSIEAALRFFPRPVDATPACDQTAYTDPTVPFAALPANAQAIEAAMMAEMPNGFDSPMYPALGGAILGGIKQAQNNPGTVSAVLLITDGAPDGPGTSCAGVNPNDPAVVAQLAATGLTKGVSTFVVGLPGVDNASANMIAQAGGTNAAIFVGTTNTQVDFQNALQKVTGQAVPCTYDVPAEVLNGMVMLTKVNVDVTSSMGMTTTLPLNQGCGQDGTGWQYDNPDMPTSIEICPATCASVKADNGGKIKVVLGCNSILR
jgi:hypothetical protein